MPTRLPSGLKLCNPAENEEILGSVTLFTSEDWNREARFSHITKQRAHWFEGRMREVITNVTAKDSAKDYWLL